MTKYQLAADAIKQSVSALDVANALGWEVRHGRCRCPIHGGSDFNCKLYPGNRGYMCWVCKSAGDVISLVRNYYHNMSYAQCISWFSDTFRMGLDIEGKIDKQKEEAAKKAIQMRKNAIAFQQWKDRMQFDLALTAQDIVKKLEDVRDERRPHRFGEEWDKDFCVAVVTLPDAREFAEECMMNCMKEVQN